LLNVKDIEDYSSFVGIPYLRGGRDVKKGVDCYGLCLLLCKEKGIDLPDYFGVPEKVEELHRTILEGRALFERISFAEEGCLVALSIRPPLITHIGYVISNNEFIHITEKSRSIISKLNDLFWEKRIRGFYKYGTSTANN
jgi:cell wall-associated NlpC family hydrolase